MYSLVTEIKFSLNGIVQLKPVLVCDWLILNNCYFLSWVVSSILSLINDIEECWIQGYKERSLTLRIFFPSLLDSLQYRERFQIFADGKVNVTNSFIDNQTMIFAYSWLSTVCSIKFYQIMKRFWSSIYPWLDHNPGKLNWRWANKTMQLIVKFLSFP